MSVLKRIGVAFLATAVLAEVATAQSGAPIPGRDVVGDWTLRITPAEQRGMSVSVQSADGGQPDLNLAITARTDGRLTCAVQGKPAQCEIDDGALVVVMVRPGARMTLALKDRTPDGFVGAGTMRVRFVPFGTVNVGSVTMTRR